MENYKLVSILTPEVSFEVEGDLSFAEDGSVSKVWTCNCLDTYKNGKFEESSYGPVTAGQAFSILRNTRRA